MRASSSCHCANCGSWARSQVKAERISGDAQSCATSCCTLGNSSDTSAEVLEDMWVQLSVVGLQSSVVSMRVWQLPGDLARRPVTDD